MKTISIFTKGALLIFSLMTSLFFAQLLTQNFDSSTDVNSYVNVTSPSNGQFNAIGSTGAGTVVSITDNHLRFTRSETNTGSYSRTRNFAPTPTSLIYRFDVAVSGNTSPTTTAASWQVGTGFGLGNSSEDIAKTHSRLGLNIGSTPGTFSLRDIASETNSATFSGMQTVTWYINNSGNSLSYTAPDASTQTVMNDTFDVWIGSVQVFNDLAVSTSGIALNNLKFVFSVGTATIDIDNIHINPFPTNLPTLSTSGIDSLSGFSYSEDFGPSSSQYFTLAATNLTHASGSIAVSSPPNYEISTDNFSFTSSVLSIPYSSGSIPETPVTKIYVRLKAGLLANNYNESVTISGGGANSFNVLCSGLVTKPTIVLGTLTANAMNYPVGTGPSVSANATVSGTNLTGNITIISSENSIWEISKDNSTWGNSISYVPIGGNVNSNANKIYVRLKVGLAIGLYAGTLTASSPNADHKILSLTGEVLKPLIKINSIEQNISFSGFTYDYAQGPSTTQNFRVDGSNLIGDIIVTSSGNWEIATNGTYSGSLNPNLSQVTFVKNSFNSVTNKRIYIRLKNDLQVGTYAGTISVTSPYAVTRTITVSGEVFPAKVEMKVMGGTNKINDGSINPLYLNRTLFSAQNLGDSQIKTYTISNIGGASLILSDFSLTGLNPVDFSFVNPPIPGTELLQNESVAFSIKFAPTTIGFKKATVVIANNDPLKNPFDFAIGGNANFCGASDEFIIAQQGFEEIPQYSELTYMVTSTGTQGPETGFSTGTSGSGDNPKSNVLYSEGERGYRIQGGAISVPQIPTSVTFNFNAADISVYSQVSLFFNIAAFSLGSKTDGMDDFDIDGISTIIDDDKIDYVLVEISPDNGVTWFAQAKIVSDEENLAWGFNTSTSETGSRDYVADNNLTYFKSVSGNPYHDIFINNLPAVTQLKVRITAQNNTPTESWIIDNIQLLSTGIVPKVWIGSTWSPSAPIKSDKIILNGNYDTASGGSLQACQCENNGTITIASNDHLIVSDQLINSGTITVENDGNFVQIHEVDTNAGSGDFIVKRNSNLKRLDYTYWASPVSGQNLKAFSTGTLNNRFYTYNEGTNLFDAIDPITRNFGDSQTGFESFAKGYAIRAFNTYPVGPPAPMQIFNGIFKGVPNNGLVTFPLVYQSVPTGNGYNLIGNPYPSNIDFYQLVDTNKALIDKTAYFWTNLNPNPAMQGNNYPNGGYYNNYAILNGTGGIPATLGGSSTISSIPTNIIKIGQGFIVKAKQTGTLSFNNAIRTKSLNSVFFNKGDSPESTVDRYWLKLTSPLDVTTTALIGYIDGATDDYDADYDADLFGLGADALFTVLADRKLGIQGKSIPFGMNDIVKVGTNHYETGTYVFSLGEMEGVFANGQSIYLKDHETGIITKLSESPYSFTANQGLTAGRFEIAYQDETVLGTNVLTKENIIVYRDGAEFVVKSSTSNITDIDLFDSSGRLIITLKSNRKEVRIDSSNFVHGVYILRIGQEGSIITKKIMK
ncbi:choice-of-anchor D domain-containing protein [Kaistella antarctica]|uniref:Por secretion system C-terminal sorting domain n=1 Tax=Kaistella antarctica TaxID=266748 RepID=A0A3S4W4H1_9FLAO|nr:choice-of-anchor D domain-containing protein [Kaistella antarctica]KEY18803.1 hypothetical protein HY04_10040 [Kaistella antarctica]SEW15242.1 Por secretion system C-terminal sorting domain-containing protein [Kaistella antarctica]VEH99475.1 Por secretion system C-terminal sorting domain [Kaistella antarctica]